MKGLKKMKKEFIFIDDRKNNVKYEILKDDAIKKYDIKTKRDFIEILISPKNKGIFIIGKKGQILEKKAI